MKKLGFFILFLLLFAGPSFAQSGWRTVSDPVEIFSDGYIQVVGISAEGQSRYNALRAATVVAQRDMLEILQGLTLYGKTTVRDGMLRCDLIKTRVHGMLQGAVKYGEKYYPGRRYAEVCLRLYLRGSNGLYNVVLPILEDKHILPPYKEYNVSDEQAVTTGEAEDEEIYDGLIVDVRNCVFKPALVNRIVTETGEVVYCPSEVEKSVLSERGCGGFAKNEQKAITILSGWGCKHPLTVKAVTVIKDTDIEVEKDKAYLIFSNNKKTKFLNNAKVIFLLK